MTDDAYLVLLEGPAVPLGTPLAAIGPLACLDTPAVRAWLAAHEVTATSPRLYLVPPEETAALPEDAEKLPVPLSPEELSTVRTRNAPEPVAGCRTGAARLPLLHRGQGGPAAAGPGGRGRRRTGWRS